MKFLNVLNIYSYVTILMHHFSNKNLTINFENFDRENIFI